MKIGIMAGSGFDPDPTLPGMVNNARRIEQMGFDSLWMATIYGYDALTALTAIAGSTTRIELGTAVVASHPRHPMAMAQQALTAAAASNGRFTLGIGLSHRYVIEQEMGLCYQRPAAHMHEYLQVLMPLLTAGSVAFSGDFFSVNASLNVPEAVKVPVIVAALGPAMLELAGSQTNGTTLWLTGPKTIAQHSVPLIRRAAAAAGRPPPRIVAGMPISITRKPASARADIDHKLALYRNIPSYRAMLDREGAEGPGDIALVGDETTLRQQLQQLRDIGVTDLNAVPMDIENGAYERTLDFLVTELETARERTGADNVF
jgi:5,10-methylenetetrahydromethanopterin reductase